MGLLFTHYGIEFHPSMHEFTADDSKLCIQAHSSRLGTIEGSAPSVFPLFGLHSLFTNQQYNIEEDQNLVGG